MQNDLGIRRGTEQEVYPVHEASRGRPRDSRFRPKPDLLRVVFQRR